MSTGRSHLIDTLKSQQWSRSCAAAPPKRHVCVGVHVLTSPVPEVIVLSSPTPERIRKSINLFELLHRQATDTTKELMIRKPCGDRKHHQVILGEMHGAVPRRRRLTCRNTCRVWLQSAVACLCSRSSSCHSPWGGPHRGRSDSPSPSLS